MSAPTAKLPVHHVQTLKVFISSPGDVGPERLIATRVLARLEGEFSGRLKLQPVLWEHEPLRATAHFQEQIVPPSQCDVVICILWSRLGTRLPDGFKRVDGSIYESGTEWEFEDAAASFHERGIPALMVYRKMSDPVVSLTSELAILERLDQKRKLDRFVAHWFGNPQEGFRAAFHGFSSADEFQQLLEAHLRSLLLERLPNATSSESAGVTTWHSGSPFRGLEAFDFEHSAVFFGRTQAVSDVQELLVRQASRGCAFVLLLGMSGGGKSSVVRAGLLPTLTHPGVVEGVGLWRWCSFRPSASTSDLCTGLAASLLQDTGLPELSERGLDAQELGALFREAPQRAVAPLRVALEQAAEKERDRENLQQKPEARLAIAIDQFEEVFTRAQTDDAERRALVTSISVLARSGLVWVVASMRSDFYARCSELPELIALKEGGTYDLLPPTFGEIEQMIVYPARAAGLRFEVDPYTKLRLDAVLHEAAVRDPKALPLLEFTLDELYKRRTPDGLLTFDAYQELGGIEGAIGRRAEEMFSQLSPEVQQCFAPLIRSLVTVNPDDDATFTSARSSLDPLCHSPERRCLVQAMVDARLLVTERAPDGTPMVGIAHEALLAHWPRLARMLADDRDFLRVRARVTAVAERWNHEGRPADLLLPAGRPLVEAEDVAQQRRDELSPLAQTYIDDSARYHAQTRRRRFYWTGAITLTVFAVVLGFALVSYMSGQEAKKQARFAVASERGNRLSLYVAELGLAQRAWNGGNVPGVLSLLDDERIRQEGNDLRGFEWYHLWQACHEKLILLSDSGVIHALAFDPQSNRLVTTGLDKTANVWNSDTGERIERLTGHQAPVYAVAFSPNGQMLATGGFDHSIFVWDGRTYKALKRLTGHLDVVTTLAFSPDGTQLVSGSDDNTVRLWNLETGDDRILWTHEKNVHHVAFATNRDIIASCSGDGKVHVGRPDKDDFQTLEYFDKQNHVRDLYGLAIDPGGNLLAVGTLDGQVALWDLNTLQSRESLTGLTDKVQGVAFSNDGLSLVATDEDGFACVWQRENETAGWISRAPFAAHAGAVYTAAFSPDGTSLATGSGDGTAKIWDTNTWELKTRNGWEPSTQSLDGSLNHAVTKISFAPGGRFLAAGDAAGNVFVWDIETWQKQNLDTDDRGDEVFSLAFSANGQQLIAGHGHWEEKGYEQLWTLMPDGQWKREPIALPHKTTVTAAAYSGDGRLLASGSFDRTIRLFDARTLPQIVPIHPTRKIRSNADGGGLRKVLEPAASPVIPTGNTADAEGEFASHDNWIYALAFSNDSKLLASGSHDRTVQLWEVPTGKNLHTLFHQAWIYDVKFSPNGQQLATACWDWTVQLWSVKKGQKLFDQPLRGHTDAVKSIAFSPDGKTLASASDDGTIILWNVKLGAAMLVLGQGEDAMLSIDFCPNGQLLAAGCADGTVKIWRHVRSDSESLRVAKESSRGSMPP